MADEPDGGGKMKDERDPAVVAAGELLVVAALLAMVAGWYVLRALLAR